MFCDIYSPSGWARRRAWSEKIGKHNMSCTISSIGRVGHPGARKATWWRVARRQEEEVAPVVGQEERSEREMWKT